MSSQDTQSTRGETWEQILQQYALDLGTTAYLHNPKAQRKAVASLQQLQQWEIEKAVKNIEGMKNAENCPSCKVQALIKKGNGTKCLNCRSEYPF